MIIQAANYSKPPPQRVPGPGDRLGQPNEAGLPGDPAHGLSFPLVVAEEIVGAMTIYGTEPDLFGSGVLDLFAEIASNLAKALSHFAQGAARRHAEHNLTGARATARRDLSRVPHRHRHHQGPRLRPGQ